MPRILGKIAMSRRLLSEIIDRIDVRGKCECWPWLGCTDKDGYGFCHERIDPLKNSGRRQKMWRVHRRIFFLVHGYLPLVVRHTCDNPPCCNPDHHLPGTPKDNARDAVERGRYRSGKRHHMFGKKLPDHVRRAVSLSNKRRRQARDPGTGRFVPYP